MNQLLNDKRVAYGLLAGGVILAVLSIVIDPLRGYDLYLAAPQIIALVVGVVAALVGAYLAFVRQP